MEQATRAAASLPAATALWGPATPKSVVGPAPTLASIAGRRPVRITGRATDRRNPAPAALIRGAARRLAADQPRPIGFLVLRHPWQFRMHVECRLVAPRLDQKDAARIVLRQQYVELLAAFLGARKPRMPFHQLDKGIAVLGLHLELDDDHQAAHKHSLRLDSAASSVIRRRLIFPLAGWPDERARTVALTGG